MERVEHLFEELCKKGKAYRAKRMAAGEKSSAYLSGRAVKVCKGQMQGENIDEITQSGQEGVYPVSENPGDMFQQKEVEELFPNGMASRDDKEFKNTLAKHAEWTEQSQYNNTFVHFQYHTIPDFKGNSYHVHQSQHYNHNYDDFRSPGFTELIIIKNYKTDNEERLGNYIVATKAYILDLKDLEAQGVLGKRVSEDIYEEIDALHENEEYCPKCTTKIREIIKEEAQKIAKEAKTKPAKGKRFAKKVKGKGGRTRTVSYGQAGKAKKGGDRIRPGTKKGHAYCARSAKIKKCKNPPCANTLSRKKWKCKGSRSVPE